MDQGLYHGVAAMRTAERRLDTVASNLANASTHGFKRAGTASESFDALLAGRVARQIATHAATDFAQGALEATGEPFDLALGGPGFFAVEGPRGEAYTRDGRFRLDPNGVLVTGDGFPVAWDGPRGTIDPLGPEVSIDARGEVWQRGASVGRLRIVDFEDARSLARTSGGFFEAPATAHAISSEAEVRQGFLEASNVSAIDEMVGLIEAQRGFEAATRIVGAIDQSYRRLTAPR